MFGGHPTITPLVLMVASELDIKGAVDVFQSRWFEEQITRETRALEDAGFGSIHWMPKGRTREASLQAMREAMLVHKQKLVAGVFVGGMEGVVEEFELFPRFQPAVPRVSLPIGAEPYATFLEHSQRANTHR